MNNLKRKLVLCIIGNFLSLFLVVISVLLLDNHGPYWRFGPNKDLIIVSVRIDTYTKYICLIGLIAIVNVMKVISQEIGMPILGFNVYNPDKKEITEFGKMELQVMANAMFMISSIRSMFMILISISQIDIALCDVLIQEFVSFFTIRMILNGKSFVNSKEKSLSGQIYNNVELEEV